MCPLSQKQLIEETIRRLDGFARTHFDETTRPVSLQAAMDVVKHHVLFDRLIFSRVIEEFDLLIKHRHSIAAQMAVRWFVEKAIEMCWVAQEPLLNIDRIALSEDDEFERTLKGEIERQRREGAKDSALRDLQSQLQLVQKRKAYILRRSPEIAKAKGPRGMQGKSQGSYNRRGDP
ncbi:MAG: hypothetical protein NT025_08425 [bacterium]|nr:hypothetical protein [bacterium]